MDVSRLLAILGFIIIGVASRLLPHPPSFSSINAIALFSAFYLGNRWLSSVTILLVVFLSDVVLGFHSTVPFVYLSFGLIILIGYRIKSRMFLQRVPLACFTASFLFFLITNFGVWMTSSLYPKTVDGLGLCYLAAIPFLANQVLGDFAYGSLLFGYVHLWKNCVHAKRGHLKSS